MITLQEKRAGSAFVAVQGASGDPGNCLPIDDPFAVENDGDDTTHERDVHDLPFARLLGGIEARGQEPVDAADLVAVRLIAIVVFNLDFISAAKINAAVAAFGITEFGVDLEIGEFLLGDKIIARSCVDQKTVSNHPTVLGLSGAGLPAGEVFAVEKLDRLRPA